MSVFHWRSIRLLGAAALPIVLMGFIWSGQAPGALAAGSSTIILSVSQTTQSLGVPVALAATVLDGDAQPISGVAVTFVLVSGPDAGESGGATTDGNGQAISSFPASHGPGIDTIGAQFTDSGGSLIQSNTVQVLWGTDPSSITLNPSTTTQNVGTSATVTATVTGPDGNPAVNQTVNFTVASGPDAGSHVAATTDANGHATFTFTDSSAVGTDIVQASFTDSFGQAATSNQVQVAWQDASSIMLSGPTSTQKLGAPVTVTATINGPDGQPAANQVVTFTVASGPDAGSHGTAVTDASGNASFTFTDTTTPGTDVVQAGFTDSIGVNRTSGSFQVVFVGDTTPPTLILPSPITVDATSPSGAVVTYTVTATDPDNSPSQLTIKCTPVSGSTFAIGTTTVNCTASDPSGNSASGSFQVVVKGAAAQVVDLISLVDSFHLSPQGIQTGFDSQLQAVQADLQANNIAQACSDLTSFINHVNAQSGQHLTVSQANQLFAAARQVQAVLGC